MANIIIVGCGRVGSQLATLLSQGDGNVCVVDRNAAAFSNLDRNFNGNTLQGVGFDEDVLVRAWRRPTLWLLLRSRTTRTSW